MAILLALTAAAGFMPGSVPQVAPVRPAAVSSSPQMLLADGPMSRRAALASLLTVVPAAASAMTVPGLNGPGLVPAVKKAKVAKPDFDSDIRDADTNHFWSPKGIMDSVPKVKGIITPKPSGFVTK